MVTFGSKRKVTFKQCALIAAHICGRHLSIMTIHLSLRFNFSSFRQAYKELQNNLKLSVYTTVEFLILYIHLHTLVRFATTPNVLFGFQ